MAADHCEMPLMISAKYLPEWSVWEGVRELVQNWHDGVLKAFERDYDFTKSRLLFEKVGGTPSRTDPSLLLGLNIDALRMVCCSDTSNATI